MPTMLIQVHKFRNLNETIWKAKLSDPTNKKQLR